MGARALSAREQQIPGALEMTATVNPSFRIP
jgi:hypothetical protein